MEKADSKFIYTYIFIFFGIFLTFMIVSFIQANRNQKKLGESNFGGGHGVGGGHPMPPGGGGHPIHPGGGGRRPYPYWGGGWDGWWGYPYGYELQPTCYKEVEVKTRDYGSRSLCLSKDEYITHLRKQLNEARTNYDNAVAKGTKSVNFKRRIDSLNSELNAQLA